ncbi:hypothetical protein BTO30_15645 [Domibacillus antri]|uniref:MurNAc-LAA domain-containing protein n=1 Tax=Domibacillus antri TaxID=1714264 RepID=A0A1Q8Q1W6_9BACI|nr:N-acetylmuramoyl-L-alanine amidase [Domibacillus antri]OLN21312.1 hypothetical protein BTO30_15645 [Domibacillus antri]
MAIAVLEAGHGLPDPGAVGFGQGYIHALEMVNEVGKRLPASIKVIKTRNGKNAMNPPKNADLNQRCRAANNAGAELFVSVHINASANTAANGYVS